MMTISHCADSNMNKWWSILLKCRSCYSTRRKEEQQVPGRPLWSLGNSLCKRGHTQDLGGSTLGSAWKVKIKDTLVNCFGYKQLSHEWRFSKGSWYAQVFILENIFKRVYFVYFEGREKGHRSILHSLLLSPTTHNSQGWFHCLYFSNFFFGCLIPALPYFLEYFYYKLTFKR